MLIGPGDLLAREALSEQVVAAVGRLDAERGGGHASRRGDEVDRLDVRLGEIQRVVHHPRDGQHVFIARVIRDDHRLIARRHAVAPDPAPLQVCRRRDERRT